MADLPESQTYETGIYQLETTDPVVGGVNGISNTPAKQLANRTSWLKANVDQLLTDLAALGITDVSGLQAALDAKLNSASYTAADVLAKLLTVDGSGSGLSADKVRGLNADFTHTLATSGSQKLPSGYIRKWGHFPSLGTGGATYNVDVVFSTAFPTACVGISVFLCISTSDLGSPVNYRNSQHYYVAGLPTQTGFECEVVYENNFGYGRRMHWEAIGY